MSVLSKSFSLRSSQAEPKGEIVDHQIFGHQPFGQVKQNGPSTIVAMFEETVVSNPYKVAIEDDKNNQLTFLELNGLANKLARVLLRTRGDVFPVCMDRSIDFIVTLLAILKTGSAYTVLDPDGPAERNLQIIQDSGAPVVLAQHNYMHMFEKALDIDQALVQTCSCPNDKNLDIPIQTQDKCYIIYTSGSTGRPKGVILTHGAASTGMAYHSLNGRDRWLLFYNPTFSAAQRTMLSTLVHGGTLIVAPKDKVQTELPRLINEFKVDALGLTPSALSILHPSQVPDLKQITLIGERIPESLVSQWAHHVELRNSYGLSECTQLNFGMQLKPGTNPCIIGRPVDTTSAVVLLPESTKVAPHNTPGELCLVGPQLALGYLNNEEATNKVFVPNPFGKGRLYRTGDLAQMSPDGLFEILGRIDFQVKINGQKVDPAEVDGALSKHPAVAASITVGAFVSERRSLVTGVVLNEGIEWNSIVSNLRKHTESLLPVYMVPAFWIPLSEVPRTSSGKIAYSQFKKEVESMSLDQLLETMNTSMEGDPIEDSAQLQIAQVWADVLGIQVSNIKRHNSFLMLGGNSILAINTIPKLAEIGFQASLRSLLSDTSLEAAVSEYERTSAAIEDPEPFSLIADPQLRQEFQNDEHIVDAYPATPLQQDLLASLVMGDDCYTYQRKWDVSGLDVGRLRESFYTLFSQSDILRTTFVAQGNSINQVIKSDMEFPWVETDLDVEEYCKQDKASPMQLQGPLFRVALLSNSVLLVSMHHSLFDFWSYRFLYQDVAAIYHGKAPLTRAPFKRFVSHINNRNWDATRQFWKEYLSGSEPTTLIHSPSKSVSKLSTTLPQTLQSQAKANNLTVGSVLYTAWAIILSKHSASQDVSFLTSLSGRDAPVPGVQTMDGPTLCMVPQRVLLDGERPVAELVQHTGNRAMELTEHAYVGLRNALAASGLQSDHFDTFLNVLIKPQADDLTASVFKRHGPKPHRYSNLTTVEVEESEESTTFRIAGPIDEMTLQFLLDSFIVTVQTILNDPSTAVASINVIGEKEKEYLMDTLSNRKTLHVPKQQLLHARFEGHAKTSPDAVAIDWDAKHQLTYAELNSRANQLAHHLYAVGVKVGDMVPLVLDKSIDTIVAILGVMKAGAAYVPLSPDNPVERNAFILDDVQAKVIISHAAYASSEAYNERNVVVMDDLKFVDNEVVQLKTRVTPDDLAYIIYTSGSTGQPKGVKVPHRSAASAVESMEVAEGRNQGEWRTLQFANYVFDASVQDIFNTLSTAGTLCMAPTETLLSELPGAINRMRVKQAIITPTVAKLIAPAEVPTLKTLIVGGEPITSDIVDIWTPSRQLLNVYGPTETSMVVTTKDIVSNGLVSNIGAPFPTVMAFVLDPESTNLVPYGGIGELCIAGPQVTNGYVNRPDLTAGAFIDGSALGVSTLYRTGDLARWLPGGEISCLGRKDSQVKIHGHRIELGEIEVAMSKIDAVQQAAVISAKAAGRLCLVAFCVFESVTELPSPDKILSTLDHKEDFQKLHQGLLTAGLTPYMIPNIVLPILDLPKLPSRKIDRKVLRRIVEDFDSAVLRRYTLSSTQAERTIVPVETATEALLEELLASSFDIPASDIGRDANFMALGGDSVAAISFSNAARKAGLSLSVKHILKSASLKDMAETVQMVSNGASVQLREFVTPKDVEEKAKNVGLNWEHDVEYGEFG